MLKVFFFPSVTVHCTDIQTTTNVPEEDAVTAARFGASARSASAASTCTGQRRTCLFPVLMSCHSSFACSGQGPDHRGSRGKEVAASMERTRPLLGRKRVVVASRREGPELAPAADVLRSIPGERRAEAKRVPAGGARRPARILMRPWCGV